MIKILLDNQEEFRAEARYVCETFFEIMGIPFSFITKPEDAGREDILLYYGSHPERINIDKITILEDEYLAQEQEKPKCKLIKGVPILYLKDLPADELVSEIDAGATIVIAADIIAASFYFLSRQEERINKKRDRWGCFSELDSVTNAWQITDVPVVNLYIEVLLKLIRKMCQRKQLAFNELPRWKDGKRFAVALTHDVDSQEKYSLIRVLKLVLKMIIKKEVVRHPYKLFLKCLFKKKNHDPYWSFCDFISLESKFKGKSTFYFVSQSTNRRYDPGYPVNRRLARLIRDICQEGWDVGLHSSYDSYTDAGMLKRQKNRLEAVLGKRVICVRQHYLRFSIDETYSAQVQAGFLYDTTLGYNEAIGFRAGLAAPFFPYDKKSKGKYGILELPLHIMDGSLFESKRCTPGEALTQVKRMIDSVEEVGGLLVVLWHTKARDEEDYPGWWDVYSEMLGYINQKQAWIANASEIYDWWINRISNISEKQKA